MDMDLVHLSISNLTLNDQWDFFSLNALFGLASEDLHPRLPNIDYNSDSHWVWDPKSNCSRIASAVYHHLNRLSSSSDGWIGWHLIWLIPIAPRLKNFIWMCFKGRLPTYAFLSNMGIGPDNPCVLCNLHRETIDHLFYHCPHALRVWAMINSLDNQCISFPEEFSTGSWLKDCSYSQHTQASIVAGAWFIWVSRCNIIFKNHCPNHSSVVHKAIAHVREFEWCIAQSQFVNSSDILFALEVALQISLDLNYHIKHIFSDHLDLFKIIMNPDLSVSWQFHPQISNVKFLLDMFGCPKLHSIPSAWMLPAINLASIGFNFHHLNLFLDGRDLPYWIMRSFKKLGFVF
ncbi:uncharacterized protein LOC120267678 [Dioscorea cayenensis subsp. rotundata]|uniref:Uncharacterized protein LOC120267678 n=1 Tax=Dioscorea cayennensis subsp. rotundata TaxID=55577 RepID=A0AB40BUY7_DIOCR|nr:uncharacterized protein LOC120267678 [Dioscorea cayenensis subsp. rotundata]